MQSFSMQLLIEHKLRRHRLYPFACVVNLKKMHLQFLHCSRTNILKANSKSHFLTKSGNVLHIILGGINSVDVSTKNYWLYL